MSRPTITRLLIAHVLAAFAGLATAQSGSYSCRDANGKALSGQFPPDGCVGEVCKTNPATGARTCTPPPETPAQRMRREDGENRQRECAKMAKDQIRDDLRFLDRYWSDEIVEDERNRALAEARRRIDDARKLLEELRAKQKKLDSEAEFYGPKHAMPTQLKGDIQSNKRLVEAQERVTTSLVNSMQLVNEKYDAMRKRRRDLLEKGSPPLPCHDRLSQ